MDYGSTLSDQDFSMASVDPNPTFDQLDDGGSSFDFSTLVQTAAGLGSEIALAVSGNSATPSANNAYPPTPWQPPLNAPKAKSSAGMILVILLLVGGVWYISQASA